MRKSVSFSCRYPCVAGVHNHPSGSPKFSYLGNSAGGGTGDVEWVKANEVTLYVGATVNGETVVAACDFRSIDCQVGNAPGRLIEED